MELVYLVSTGLMYVHESLLDTHVVLLVEKTVEMLLWFARFACTCTASGELVLVL